MRLERGKGLRVVLIQIDMQPVRAQVQMVGGKVQYVGGIGLDRGDKAPAGIGHAGRMRSAGKTCKGRLACGHEKGATAGAGRLALSCDAEQAWGVSPAGFGAAAGFSAAAAGLAAPPDLPFNGSS